MENCSNRLEIEKEIKKEIKKEVAELEANLLSKGYRYFTWKYTFLKMKGVKQIVLSKGAKPIIAIWPYLKSGGVYGFIMISVCALLLGIDIHWRRTP